MTEKRRITGILLTGAVYLAAALCLAVLVGIIGYVVIKGLPAISWKLITSVPSVTKGTLGILPFLLNTLYMILLTLLIVLPIGVGAAVYLNEYASNKKLIRVIEFTTETLAGILCARLRDIAPALPKAGPANQPAFRLPYPYHHDAAHHYPHHTGKPENRAHLLP